MGGAPAMLVKTSRFAPLLGGAGLLTVLLATKVAIASPATRPAEEFRRNIQPLLAEYCYDCHGDGQKKGGLALDALTSDADLLQNHELWWRVLKNVRAGIMPPHKKARPSAQEKQRLADWIEHGAFGIDPEDPDPGRVTVRRLNRVEYRNTIRDLMGVDFNTTEEFPPDDTGYGFDTIGDVLSISPLLLEKYMQAAEKIVASAVPVTPRSIEQTTLLPGDFASSSGSAVQHMSFYKDAMARAAFTAHNPGSYRLTLNLAVRGEFAFDPGRCRLVLKVDDREQWKQEFKWDNGRKFSFQIPQQWESGVRELVLELHPLTKPNERRNSIELQIQSLQIEGPLEPKYWVATKNYARFFPRPEPPSDELQRAKYAREVLAAFARKAFRRPPDPRTVDRLAQLAETVWAQPGKSFEQGIREAMVAVLASPRFLFRIEQSAPARQGQRYSPVDEYALASRLSYFLWSTMPDDELTALADRGELRKNYTAQVKRLLADSRSDAMIRNFAGQWLQLRDLDGIAIDARVVLARDNGTEKELQERLAQFRARQALLAQQQANGSPKTRPATQPAPATRPFRRFGRPAVELDEPLRSAMRQ